MVALLSNYTFKIGTQFYALQLCKRYPLRHELESADSVELILCSTQINVSVCEEKIDFVLRKVQDQTFFLSK